MRASIDQILSRSEEGNTNIKFVRRLPATVHEQDFTNVESTETRPATHRQNVQEYNEGMSQSPNRGNKSSREDSYSPLRKSPSGEKTVVKQERIGRLGKVDRVEKRFKIPKEMERKLKFMSKTEMALM